MISDLGVVRVWSDSLQLLLSRNDLRAQYVTSIYRRSLNGVCELEDLLSNYLLLGLLMSSTNPLLQLPPHPHCF